MKFVPRPPSETAHRILAARAELSSANVQHTIPLAGFQQAGFLRASAIMEKRGGVLVADSVGLGKTYVALALIETAVRNSKRVLVVAPASLRSMWRREISSRLHLSDVSIVSHTALAVGRQRVQPADLVVVDEAHAFRNPATARYRALREACRAARVVLLTATPINNSLSDLYFQLRLFCGDGAFRDVGIASLKQLLLEGQPNDVGVQQLRRAVVVRRTREHVRAAALAEGFRFPAAVVVRAIRYDLPIPPATAAAHLQRLTFPGYQLGGRARVHPELLRLGFLKRMESSVHALRITIRRQLQFYRELKSALSQGMLLRPRVFRSLFALEEDSLQLVLDAVALEQSPEAARESIAAVEAEQQVLTEFLHELPAHDAKLVMLQELLASRPRAARTIVFTEYRDTARHLWSVLRRRFPTGLVDGSGAWIGENRASRRAVVERFAPRANRAAVHDREAVRVLIATDVLAEGLNLQDADMVVSYDLPWNPVRLLQRLGRVDRIGSEHRHCYSCNFLPDREFDEFLGLVRTIRRKLETVHGVVGLEHSVLAPSDDFESFARAVAAEDAEAVVAAEDRSADRASVVQWREPAELPTLDGATPIACATRDWTRLMVGSQTRTDWFLDFATPAGEITPAGAEGERMLRVASELESGVVTPACVSAAEVAARAIRERPMGLPGGGAGASGRMARALRRELSKAPLFETAILERADHALSALGGINAVSQEDALEELLRTGWSSLGELVEGIESALSQHRKEPDELRITGVIAVN